MTLLLPMEKYPMYGLLSRSCFYCPNLITVASLQLEICQSHVIVRKWGHYFIGRKLNWTLWMRFTWCPNLMFLSSRWLEIYRFSNCSFCWLWATQSSLSFSWHWASQNWPYLFILVTLGRPNLHYWVWVRQAAKNQSKTPWLDKEFRNHT